MLSRDLSLVCLLPLFVEDVVVVSPVEVEEDIAVMLVAKDCRPS